MEKIVILKENNWELHTNNKKGTFFDFSKIDYNNDRRVHKISTKRRFNFSITSLVSFYLLMK